MLTFCEKSFFYPNSLGTQAQNSQEKNYKILGENTGSVAVPSPATPFIKATKDSLPSLCCWFISISGDSTLKVASDSQCVVHPVFCISVVFPRVFAFALPSIYIAFARRKKYIYYILVFICGPHLCMCTILIKLASIKQ